ncbi:hypothetical protein P7H00_14375 [Enterococcus pseudoavium]|uniref:Uncharacterized protein n=1 Tax=Enterococcus pseudoavium TaxID=44007 RepID=A0AAE4L3S6_9ENTE|nr:hypothetical protein [Enterococcus pseudoavium]MDT2738288.1 hypothetical protein [Enterococcus pseudoavium]
MEKRSTYYPENQKKYEQSLDGEARAKRNAQKRFSSVKSFIRNAATVEQLNDIIELAQSKLDEKE